MVQGQSTAMPCSDSDSRTTAGCTFLRRHTPAPRRRPRHRLRLREMISESSVRLFRLQVCDYSWNGGVAEELFGLRQKLICLKCVSLGSPDTKFEVLGSPSSLLSISLSPSQELYTRRGTLTGVSGRLETVSFLSAGTTAHGGLHIHPSKGSQQCTAVELLADGISRLLHPSRHSLLWLGA